MNLIQDFFSKIKFDFKNDLKSVSIILEKNEILSEKIKDKVFFYQCPPQTKTSFYLITQILSEDEFKEVKKYIWNEDKADLIFKVNQTSSGELFDDVEVALYYAKFSPADKNSTNRIDTFSGNKIDNAKIEKINKWQFDSGAFWLSYKDFIDKVKKSNSIDKELITTLDGLRKDLISVINDKEVVQALIDRTLYIKYLEDKHIINSYFYGHYFQDNTLSYKKLLEYNDAKRINSLFGIINEIFNNYLFVTPEIEEKYLNKQVLELIYQSISGTNVITGQLRLFDFQFNVLPVEFISYIYEIFLTDEQKKNGIYYTPKKLAQLIIDDVIPNGKIGSVLDPSCGSGMFLIVAYQKLLENTNIITGNVAEKIEYRIRLLSENIFGIEKQSIAQRFTIFSLSLQIFKDLNPEEIKEFIANELRTNGRVELFGKHSFFNNIIQHNSLDIQNPVFSDRTFDYIVGNPPFFNIEESNDEITFLSEYEITVKEKTIRAKDIVGSHQISQCFFIKIKEWSNQNTRFGFVSNNSNFYNENSKSFQDFFYQNYQIEKIYELSKVKQILFEQADESVNALIFNNGVIEDNTIEYYPVEMGLFSEKPFELLVIQESSVLYINQSDFVSDKLRLRDFLIGNEYDRNLLRKIAESNTCLDEFILIENNKKFIHRGIEIWGENAREKEFGINKKTWKGTSDEYRKQLLETFVEKYFNKNKTDIFNTEYVKPKNLSPFVINNIEKYINSIENFHRPRTEDIYIGDKIILSRLGNSLNAVFSNEKIYFDFSVYVLKLKDSSLYFLITAILNSKLTDYYTNQYLRKRVFDSFPRIGIKDIRNIPVPKYLDPIVVDEISAISKDLTNRKVNYNEKVQIKLNELVFQLYGLSYNDKQRVKDFFVKKSQITKKEIEIYKNTLLDTIFVFFEGSISIQHYHYKEFNLIAVGVYFNSTENKPPTDKTAKYMINEIFNQNPDENFLASQEKIYGKDCVFILKKDDNIHWTETKAFEDGQEILNQVE